MAKTEQRGGTAYLDYIRFFSLLLVILFHAVIGQLEQSAGADRAVLLVFNELSRMSIPMFFMISGFLLLRGPAEEPMGAFYKKRLGKILPPLLVWNVLYGLYYRMSPGELLAAVLNEGSAFHLWFVYSLLGMYLITPFLRHIVHGCTRRQLWWLTLLVSFPGALRPLLNMTTGVYVKLFDALMEPYLACFLLGWLLGTAELNRKKLLLAALALVSGFCLGYFGNLLSGPELPFNGGYMLNHLLGGGGLFLLLRAVPLWERDSFSRAGAYLASLCFQCYFAHVMILGHTPKWLPALPPVPLALCEWLLTAVLSFGFAAVLHAAAGLLRRLQRS